MAKTSKAQQEASRRYIEKNLDRIALSVPKGTAAAFRETCERKGVSMRSVLLVAIADFIEAHPPKE